MPPDFYTDSNIPQTGDNLDATVIKAEFDLVSAGFVKVAPYTGNGGKLVAINAAGTAQEAIITGTGVQTAIAVNVGSVGALVTNGGALGTPTSGVATNLTGTAAGLTAGNVTTNANLTGGVTSVGNAATVVTNANLTGHITSVGNAAVLGSFTSLQLLTALTDETGTGAAVFGTSPALTTPAITGLATGTGVATANTASTLVARDASGNFAAGTITAALTGTATTATTATNLSGGSVNGTTGTFTTSGSQQTVRIIDTGASGASLRFEGNGATTPNKVIRVANGIVEVVNSANTQVILTLTDAGALTVPAGISGTTITASAGISATTGTFSGLISADGGQIKFPAAQNASADANTLDDYEEGSWTPNVGGTATYSVQVGEYVKIGRLVTFNFRLTVTTLGTGSNYQMFGLPFSASGSAINDTPFAVSFLNLALSMTNVVGLMYGGVNYCTFFSTAAAAASLANNLIIGSGTTLTGRGSYYV